MDFNDLFTMFGSGVPGKEETEADKLKKLAESMQLFSSRLGEVKKKLDDISPTTQSSNPESK